LSPNANWNAVGGNYIFAKDNGPTWSAIYIGQTESFKDRLPSHDKLPCAQRNGFTHIHARANENEASRLKEEADLIANYRPPCNVQGT